MAKRPAIKVYLDEPEEERLREVARAEDRTITSLIRRAIRDYLNGRDGKKSA